MIPATNVTDAHAQNFVANDKLLLATLTTFAHYTILEILDVFMSVIEEMAVIPPAMRQTRSNPSLLDCHLQSVAANFQDTTPITVVTVAVYFLGETSLMYLTIHKQCMRNALEALCLIKNITHPGSYIPTTPHGPSPQHIISIILYPIIFIFKSIIWGLALPYPKPIIYVKLHRGM